MKFDARGDRPRVPEGDRSAIGWNVFSYCAVRWIAQGLGRIGLVKSPEFGSMPLRLYLYPSTAHGRRFTELP